MHYEKSIYLIFHLEIDWLNLYDIKSISQVNQILHYFEILLGIIKLALDQEKNA